MHIARIELENFMPYAGRHCLDLGPTLYGVRAEWLGRPGRSNWAGKTSLLESIPLALYGKPPARKGVEDWITDGTDMGRVRLTFDSGVAIEHKRTRGGATVVQLLAPGERVLAKGDEARRQVTDMLGLDRDDFFATCFFRQKEMSAIVAMQPAAFSQTVIGWLRLEALEAVEEAASDAEAEAAAIVAREDAMREAALAELKVRLSSGGSDMLLKDIRTQETQLRELEQRYRDAVGARTTARALLDAAQAYERVAGWIAEAEELRAEADRLDATVERAALYVDTRVETATTAEEGIANRYRECRDNAQRLKDAVAGEFDGICPVMRKACPAKAEVVQHGKRLTKEHAVAEAQRVKARVELDAARVELQAAIQAQKDHELMASKSVNNRNRAAELEYRAAKVSKPKLTMKQAQDALEGATTTMENLTGERERIKAQIAKDKSLLDRLATTHERSNAAKEAKVRGRVRRAAKLAQRLIAQGAMGWIANEGNAMLATSGIDLQFQVQWAKESKGFEPICGQCGRVFANTKSVKPCVCGQVRQPRLLDRPSLDMSAKSGAADDLVGMAIRLGAAAWLRNSRGSTWSCCIIDEPFGALDGANRDAVLTALLASLRTRYGFEQAFVVAHHEEVMSAMPGTVLVVAGPGGSRVEVMD